MATNIEDKNIYKSGNNLYIKSGNTFYRVPDAETLQDLVFQKGYSDTRKEVPANAVIENFSNSTKIMSDTGTAHFKGGDNGTLIKFAEDPDGEGPMSTSTVYHVDPTTNKIRPILSETAFNNAFKEDLQSVVARNGIATVSLNSLGKNGPFSGYQILSNDYGIKDNGKYVDPPTEPDLEKLKSLYGKTSNSDLNKKSFQIMDGFLNIIGGDPTTGISKDLLSSISNDKNLMTLYIGAFAYGGYTLSDIYRDIKRRELVKQGDTSLNGLKIIDESTNSSSYYGTPTGAAAKGNSLLTPPEYIGDLNPEILNNSVFKLPSEAFEILVPPLDPNSKVGQEELDKIKSIYHDALLQQAQASTDQEKIAADYNYNAIKNELEKSYKIKLSDNANEAWNQINSLSAQASGSGLVNSGIHDEAVNRYLADRRKSDERSRVDLATKENENRRIQLLNYGTPAEINALSEEEKVKYGLKPSAETAQWYSYDNLKKLYPDLSDDEINKYKNSIIDEYGNYRSVIFQKLNTTKLGILDKKKTFQLGSVQVDPDTGKVVGGSGALLKKALEEEKAAAPYTQQETFSKPNDVTTTTTTTTAAPIKTPTYTPPKNSTYISNESELQKYRDQLAKSGVAQTDWNKYITKQPDNKLYFTSPTTTTPKPVVPTNSNTYIKNEAELQGYRSKLAKAGIAQPYWGDYITKGTDGKMYWNNKL